MNENGWIIKKFDSGDPKKRTEMFLEKGNLKLTVFSGGIPSKWKIGDEIGDLEKDTSSKITIRMTNKTKGGTINAKVADDPDNILKFLGLAERIEYPNLGEDKAQKIVKKGSCNIELEDGSSWYFHPTTLPLPKEWAIGDPIVVEHVGAFREGDKTRNYNLKNMRLKKDFPHTPKKYEQSAFWENPGEKKPESYDTEKGRKGVIYDKPGEYDLHKDRFDRFGKELVIQALTEKYIFLSDGNGSWAFRWHSPIGGHGQWKRGDRVIVNQSEKMAKTEAYSLRNLETEKFLVITPAKEGEEEGDEE